MRNKTYHEKKFKITDLLLIFLFLIVFIAVFPSFSKTVADIIQSLGIGIGALIAGYGGKNIISDYLLQSKLEKIKNHYPVEELDVSFRLIQCTESGDPDAVYIHDFKDNTKHWIVNQKTRIDLGFNPSQYINISKSEFEKIKPGESFDTTK